MALGILATRNRRAETVLTGMFDLMQSIPHFAYLVPVVVLPLAEYSAWKETLYLVANPANAEHLRQSIAEARAGKVEQRELLEA